MKLIKAIFLLLLLVLIISAAFQFVINTKYSFPEPGVFYGEKLYNPYRGMDSTKWRRANFHLHTKMLFGLTAGSANSYQLANSFYNFFDFDIYCISDYMHINASGSNNKTFIPVYEHGYQFYKVHQLVINAKKVSWIDYDFRQTLNNKQYIIDCLKQDTTTLVAIVHPKYRNAYTDNDFKYLGNYDCLEIANSKYLFVNYYDLVLSSGQKVFLMANDDSHDLSDSSDGAVSFNVINGDLEKNSIIHALKTGKSYGVNFKLYPFMNNYEKEAALQRLPVIEGVNVKNDTLLLRMNKNVDTIKYIGQNGILKKTSINCNKGSYKFRKDDTYIRTEIVCKDGSVYYLNPVFRYDGSNPGIRNPAVNVLKTRIYRILFFSILLLTILFFKKYAKYLPHWRM